MEAYRASPPTREELDTWNAMGRKFDPRSGEKLKKKSEIYKYLKKQFTSTEATEADDVPDCSGDMLAGLSLTGYKKDQEEAHKKKVEKKKESLYVINGKAVHYNDETMTQVRSMRRSRFCAITLAPIDIPESVFEYPFIWNPVDGSVVTDDSGPVCDPYGPLCFNVNDLIYYWWHHRLDGLWIPETVEMPAHYGVRLGAGKNFAVTSRGIHPEWYLFRLPVPPYCYLEKGLVHQVITMGPEMSRDQVETIYKLATVDRVGLKPRFEHEMRRRLPNLLEMYDQYNAAIDDTPNVGDTSELDKATIMELKTQANLKALEVLKNM